MSQRRLRLATVALVALVALTALTLAAAAATGGKGGKLSKEDRAAIAAGIANGNASTTLLVATAQGGSKSVAAAIGALGGTIEYQDDALGYLRVRVPADKADAVAKADGVQAAEVDKVIPLDDPQASGVDPASTPAPPGPATPAENAYMPTEYIGAPQFVAAHPTYDGRGVKIGILDTGVDLLTPELQTAKTLDGSPVKKIVDWTTATDPLTDNDPTWLDMKDQVTAAAGTFTYGDTTYTAPAATGSYRIALFSEASLGGASEYGRACGSDLNRDGDCTDSFAVLWDGGSNVWVDTNQDNSFADETAMTDYKVKYDMGTFGTDNPATTGVRESVPFVVQIDGKDKFVNIGIVAGEHGTHVAGIAAGKHFFGGSMNGTAPEAQIVSVRACMFTAGCTAHALIEGMIYLEKQANVDVINMSIGGLPALNDGNNTRAILYNRLIDQSGAQMFLSAGNDGAGVNTVGDPAVATKVMGVGAYATKDIYDKEYGADTVKDEQMFEFSSRGPAENGGFKPNVVAPGSAISSIPAWEGQACLAYTCPAGYALLQGTSMAAPSATGGAALLISAAKQAGVQWKPDQLRQAINSSARFLTGTGAYEQGNGLFQVGSAWDLLKQNIKTTDITSTAPVNTVISQFLATPNQGVGIYEREGWGPANIGGSRTITFTRASGGGSPVSYNVSWVGDPAFSSASTLSLAKNQPASLTVNIAHLDVGVHSAILRLDDPATAGIDYEVLNTIVVASQFDASNDFSVSQTGTADRADKSSFFYFVPANTPAFKVDLTGINGRIRFMRFSPYGVEIDSTSTGYQTGGTQSRTVSNPLAGVWEVVVDASRTAPVPTSTYTITASILGVDISPSPWVVDPTTIGTTYSQLFTFTNRFGAFTGGAVGTALGSAFADRPTIAAGGPQQTYTVDVPAGATAISAKIGNASDSAADLDLFLFDCHTGTCVQAAKSTSGTAEEFVSVANPAAGQWKVLVDPFAVPSGSTAYDYLDAVQAPGFGSVTITDPAAAHAHGTSWSATASAKALAAPASGRFLQGFVQVKSGSTLLGSAEVDLKNVTP